MNTDKINKKIRKISLLLETFEDGNQMSALEKDLLLSYIKDLYDMVLDTSVAKREVREMNVDIQVTPDNMSDKREKIPTASLSKTTEHETHTEQVVVPEVTAAIPQKKEVVQDTVTVTETVKIPVVKPLETHLTQEAMDEIFKEEKVNELSDKLSMSHIDDIRKGLGLNERLFTQKELFGDNSSHFNEVLDTLNRMSTYDEAKTYLLKNVIPVYHWDSEGKIKKAATFIKLVKRRFI
jgi:hypothetical protein